MRFARVLLATLLLLSSPLLLLAQSVVSASASPKSSAQLSFDELKGLVGEWEGKVTVDPPMDGMGPADMRVVIRETSKGNAIVHEMQGTGTPFWIRTQQQAANLDHPVTMLYLDGGRLNLVHYCDAGNRPHMVAEASPQGKKVVFDFVDLSGSPAPGYMHGAAFTPIDANHHNEDWTFMMPNNKLMHAHFVLHRVD